MLNFHDQIKNSIDIRSNVRPNKLKVEAKNWHIMLHYVDTSDNTTRKKIFKVEELKYEASNDYLDNSWTEAWANVNNVSSFYITKPILCSSGDFLDDSADLLIDTHTSYLPTAASSYVLLYKEDITKISVGSGSLGLCPPLEKAAIVIDASGCASQDALALK